MEVPVTGRSSPRTKKLRPGLLHCHINHHVTNDGAEVDGGGGMTMIIDVTA
jgi:hypothetical protein